MGRASGIPNTSRVARAAAARSWMGSMLRAVGLALSVAMGVAVIAVLVDRAVGPVAPLWLLVGLPGIAGLLIGVLIGASRALSPAKALVEVDDRLGLHDALSSAAEFSAASGDQDEAFTTMATLDAERLATEVRVRKVMPLRPGGAWLVWPLVGAASVVIGLYVPHLERRATDDLDEAQRTAQIESVTSQIADARDAVQQALQTDDADAASLEELRTLEELEQELTGEGGDPEQIASRAAEELERIADDLDRQAEQATRAGDELRRQLADAEPQSEGPAAELAEALAEGDLAEARDAARRMMDQIETLDEAEREALARDLAALAEQLDQVDDPEPVDEGLADDLRAQGLDDQAVEELADQTDAGEIEDRLEDEGVDPELARRLAERIAEENQQREAREQANEQREALNESLQRTAEEVDPTPEPDTPEQAERQQGEDADQGTQPEGSEQKQGGDQQEGAEQKQGGDQQEGAEQKQGGDQQEGAEQKQGGDQQEGAEQKQGGEQQEGAEQKQGGEQQEGAEQKQGGEQQEGAEQKQGGEQQEGAEQKQGGDRQEGAEQKQGGEQTEGGDPTPTGEQREGTQPGDEQPGAQQSPDGERREVADPQADQQGETRPGGSSTDGERSLSEQLERMAEQQEQARRQAEDAEALRRRAQEFLDNATPEERQQLEELARQLAAAKQQQEPSTAPTQRELFDARSTASGDEPPAEQVIAQWYNEDAPPGERVGRAEIAERMKEAAAGAERAIEQQQVPRRHRDLLRRVMRRYAGETDPAPTVEDAKDAGAP